MKKFLGFIASFAVFLILLAMAFIGLNGILKIDVSEGLSWIYDIEIFYSIFTSTESHVIFMEIPLFAGIIYSLTNFCEKNIKVLLFVLEIAAIVIICLAGFGVIEY